MTNLANLRLRGTRNALCSLLLLTVVAGCASAHRAASAATTVELSREEMFEALTSHTWCDRDFPAGPTAPEPPFDVPMRTQLSLYRDGTFLPEYTSDIYWGPAQTRWNFQKTGPGKGVLYLVDPWNRTGSIAVFEFLTSDRLRLSGLWANSTAIVTYGRCDANESVEGLAEDLPEIARKIALAVLAGTSWPRVSDEPSPITVTHADGSVVEESLDVPSREAVAALAPTVWTSVSDLSRDQPAKIEVFGDGRTYVTLPASSCTSSNEGQLGLPVRRLPDGGCIEEVPYNARYRRTGRFLLFNNAPYLPVGADLKVRYEEAYPGIDAVFYGKDGNAAHGRGRIREERSKLRAVRPGSKSSPLFANGAVTFDVYFSKVREECGDGAPNTLLEGTPVHRNRRSAFLRCVQSAGAGDERPGAARFIREGRSRSSSAGGESRGRDDPR